MSELLLWVIRVLYQGHAGVSERAGHAPPSPEKTDTCHPDEF